MTEKRREIVDLWKKLPGIGLIFYHIFDMMEQSYTYLSRGVGTKRKLEKLHKGVCKND